MRIAYANLLPATIDDRFLRAPLAVAYLAAYAAARREALDEHDVLTTEELLLSDSPSATADLLMRSDPELIALSTYVWNADAVKHMVAELRDRSDAAIVLGGPEVQFTPTTALQRFKPDFVCSGEGEIAFHRLIEQLERHPPADTSAPGMVSTAGSAGPAPLATPLDSIPSPFASGVIDVPSSSWVDLETTRGCPFACAFCLYGKGLPDRRWFSLDRVRSDIHLALSRGASDLYFLDPTFNIPRDRCRELVDLIAEVNSQRARLYIEARAEAVDEELADKFVAAGVTSVEVGLQAVDETTLDLMHRRLGRRRFVEGCKHLTARGIAVEIGLILGLPGDTAASVRETVDFATQDLLGEIFPYRLRVLPGSSYWHRAAELGLDHLQGPPYFVQQTPHLSASMLDDLETEVADALRAHNGAYRALIEAAPTRAPTNRGEKTRKEDVEALDFDRGHERVLQ